MIAAVGRFDTGVLVDAVRAMALNANAAYGHEYRVRGDSLRHDCGWGAALLGDGGFSVHRSTAPCFEDAGLNAIAGSRTDLAILHARRTPERETIALRNTHPFAAAWRGTDYVFCHNGAVNDRSQLTWDPSLTGRASIDSEELFFHVLTRLDEDAEAESVVESLAAVEDFTALNCFLASSSSLLTHTRMSPDIECPRYYTMWRGRGDGFEVVSSEIVDGFDVEWSAVPQGSAFRIPRDH
ncbi:MAG: class II glutamine amidotransferase [Candidatus Eisenbacteria bacterium]